jgi:hypothetical protein
MSFFAGKSKTDKKVLQNWHQTGKRSSSTQRAIEIDSYEVTIFPAESVKNTHTLPALSKQVNDRDVPPPIYLGVGVAE